MSFWSKFSQLTVVGSAIFPDPLFTELHMDIGSHITIVYVPSFDALKERSIRQHSDNFKTAAKDKREAVLLFDFPNPVEMKSLTNTSENYAIFGLPSLYALRFNGKQWIKRRPVFCFSMHDAVVTVTGYRNTEVVNRIATFVNWMGGTIRRKLGPDVTHLIAFRCSGEKVRKAALVSVNVATMKASWVENAWELRRLEPFFNACNQEFVDKHRAKVFNDCRVFFVGFPRDSATLTELKAILFEHDGTIADDLTDSTLTHVLVADEWRKQDELLDASAADINTSDPNGVFIDPDLYSQIVEIALRVPVLRLDWFWKSLQCTFICNPSHFTYVLNSGSSDSPNKTIRCVSDTLNSATILSKESEEPTIFEQCYLSPEGHKKLSNISPRNASGNSTPAERSFLREELIAQLADPLRVVGRHARGSITPQSPSYNMVKSPRTPLQNGKLPTQEFSPGDRKSPCASAVAMETTPIQAKLKDRQHRVFEFFLTEQNYVAILSYLTQTAFSEVIAEDQVGGPIIPKAEADMVFGKLTAVYQLHQRLQTHLVDLESSWDIDRSRLGELLLPHINEMEKVYSHYMACYNAPHLHQLGRDYPRFLAFMRQVERRRESGRQSLSDLLVRPVQRLPSMLLLVQAILKFTPNGHPDHSDMVDFVSKLDGILGRINLLLKKTDDYMHLLKLTNNICGVPPEFLSSSRSLVSKLGVFQLGVSSGGVPTVDQVYLFLLNDCLEVVCSKNRSTGEPKQHALEAALAAVAGDSTSDPPHEGTGDLHQNGGGDGSKISAACSSLNVAPTVSREKSGVFRTGSGASAMVVEGPGISGFARGSESKKRHEYTHLRLLKLQHIKRVLDLNTSSPERAAFSLIVRDAEGSDSTDHVLTFCLAASFTATVAVNSGRCPEAVKGAFRGIPDRSGGVSRLQHCVQDAKTHFLQSLCQHIMQVSCLASSAEDLLVEVQPEVVLDFDLDTVFENAECISLKSKKFARHLGRAISMKTPRRLPNPFSGLGNSAQPQISKTGGYGTSGVVPLDGVPTSAVSSAVSLMPMFASGDPAVSGDDEGDVSGGFRQKLFATPSRPSVLGNFFSGLRLHTAKAGLITPSHNKKTEDEHEYYQDDDADIDSIGRGCLVGSDEDDEEGFGVRCDENLPQLCRVESVTVPATNSSTPFHNPCGSVDVLKAQKELWLVATPVTETFGSNYVDVENDSFAGDVGDDLIPVEANSNSEQWPTMASNSQSEDDGKRSSMIILPLSASTSSLRSLGGCANPNRKSLGRIFGSFYRHKPKRDYELEKRPASCNRRAPLANGEEEEARGERAASKGTWLDRCRLTRLHSVDAKTSRRGRCAEITETHVLDKSVSECNLSVRGNHSTLQLPTTSTTDMKTATASPFRVPLEPPLRRSIAAKNPRHISISNTAGVISSWSSLVTLAEGDKKNTSKDIKDPRSLSLNRQKQKSSSNLIPFHNFCHKKEKKESRQSLQKGGLNHPEAASPGGDSSGKLDSGSSIRRDSFFRIFK